MRKLFTLILFLYSSISFSQVQILDLNINEIRGTNSNTGGCADIDSVFVRTTGVVYGRNFRQSNNGLQISLVEKRADTLLSNSCGIGLFKGTMDLPVTLNEGDSIRVVGFVNCFRGLSQIRPDSIQILKTNCELKQPRTVNVLNEVSESYLVKILNAEFTSWQSSPPPAGFTVKAFTGTPGTTDYKEYDIRIDNDCDLYGQSMPVGKVDIVGIGGQFFTSSGDGYQLLPRSSSDITPAAPQELPIISFQDTVYTSEEGTQLIVTLKSSLSVTNQLTCLLENTDVTTTSSDYTIQQPQVVTFPANTTISTTSVNINSDTESESDEEFLLKIVKTSPNYVVGSDSIVRVKITGSTSVKSLKNSEIYVDGNLKVNLPNNFQGDMKVYNSFGQIIFESSNDNISKDIERLKNYPTGLYRVLFTYNNKRLIKTIHN